jgi:hypothetical protein
VRNSAQQLAHVRLSDSQLGRRSAGGGGALREAAKARRAKRLDGGEGRRNGRECRDRDRAESAHRHDASHFQNSDEDGSLAGR